MIVKFNQLDLRGKRRRFNPLLLYQTTENANIEDYDAILSNISGDAEKSYRRVWIDQYTIFISRCMEQVYIIGDLVIVFHATNKLLQLLSFESQLKLVHIYSSHRAVNNVQYIRLKV